MKKLILKSIFIVFVLTAIISCGKDDDVLVATCDRGYSGVNCDIPFNTPYNGTGTVSETCNVSGTTGYSVSLVNSTTDPLQFTIFRLWDIPNGTVNCMINETNSNQFTAARQTTAIGFDIEIISGELIGNTINYDYKVYSTGGTNVIEQCSGTIVKD